MESHAGASEVALGSPLKPMNTNELWIGWTTVETEVDAKALARQLVARKLAACVQVDGPIRSYYQWEGKLHDSPEWRLQIKSLKSQLQAIEQFLESEHPYETPEWVAMPAQVVSAAYLDWTRHNLEASSE